MQALISPASPSFIYVRKTATLKPLSSPIAINFWHNSSPSRTIKNQLFVNSVSMASGATVETATAPKWAQKTVTIPAQRRGCHLITSKGIWLCEHRDAATPRKVVVTLNGI